MMERTKSQRVLVTGGTGFVGSHLVDLLLRKGYDVTCLVRDPARLQWLTGLNVRIMQGDCAQPESLVSAVRDISHIFHVAGLTKARRACDYYAVNHVGTANLLEVCARHNPGIKKFLLVSSLAAAGPSPDGKPVMATDVPRPITDYGRSKLLAEEETIRYKDSFPVVIIRPSAVYGPRDRDVYELFQWAARGVTVEVGNGEHYINPCYVEDLAAAMLLAAEKETQSGSTYFVAENRVYSWSEFRNILGATGGVKALTVKVPYAAAYLVGIASECVGLLTSRPGLMNRQKVREAAQKDWICYINKTETELGFKHAYPLQRGLEITWQWYSTNNWIR